MINFVRTLPLDAFAFSRSGLFVLHIVRYWFMLFSPQMLYFLSSSFPGNTLKPKFLRGPHPTAAWIYIFVYALQRSCGPGSSVGIATELRAGRSGIESRWGRDFPPVQTGRGAHPASCKVGTWSFLGVKCGRGVLLTTYPLLVPRSWKSRAIPLPTLWTTPGL